MGEYVVSNDVEKFTEKVADLSEQSQMVRGVVVMGSVLAHESDEDKKAAELGMLSVHENYLRKGIATHLINAAEARARELECETIRLEILSPRDWEHPMKVMLKKWYTERLSFVEGQTEDFASAHPQLVKLLSCSCKFTAYSKKL